MKREICSDPHISDSDSSCDSCPFAESFDRDGYESSLVASENLFSMFISPLGVKHFFKYA